jgi:putative ABC transport system permease protein
MRWTKFFRRAHWDEERAREMEHYLQIETDDNIARGMPPDEARFAALRKLGNQTRIREQIYEMNTIGFLETLWQDVRYGSRMLRKSPGFAAVAILTLALGIGASTVVFSAFYNLLFNAFAARDANRLVVPVFHDGENGQNEDTLHFVDLDAIRQQNQVFENIVGYILAGGIVLASDGPRVYQFNVSRVTSDAFEFYGVPPLVGRGILPDDGKPGAPPVFVMSYKTWKGEFNADLGIVGKNFTLDGELRTLVGIMPPRFQAFGPPLEQIWIPITRTPGAPSPFEKFPPISLARLKPDVSLEAASADLNVIVQRLAKARPDNFPKRVTARVESAADSLLGPQGGGPIFHSDVKHMLYDLLAAVMMLLLIACSNVANLLLARATMREREIAVRAALGASRRRLVRQLLVESSVLAIPACVAGCFLAWLGTKLVAAILPQTLGAALGSRIGAETNLGLNPPVLLFAVGVTLLSTLICGVSPAVHSLRADLQSPLSSAGKGASGSFRHGRLRGGLLIGEVALSIVLLIGTGLMMRSFFLLTHVELGFNPRNVLLIAFLPPPSRSMTPAVERFASPQGKLLLQEVIERLKKLPGVADVSVEDTLPGYGPVHGPQVTVPGTAHADEEAGLLACDENFLRTLEIHLVQGRWISGKEVETAQHVAVIDQRLARDFFGDKSPIGQQLKVKSFVAPFSPAEDAYFQIVGVARDMKSAGPQEPAIPMAFLPYTVRGGFALLLKTTVEPGTLTHSIQEQIWAVDRDEIVGFSSPLTELLHRNTYATPEFAVMLSAPLAGIGLLLVVIGIFGVMAYTVSLQTHEIGIRMALGAQQRDVQRLVMGHGLLLTLVGTAIGLAGAFALTRYLRSLLFEITPTDPATFAGVVVLLLIVALAACYIPARRAMRVDPMVALRYE